MYRSYWTWVILSSILQCVQARPVDVSIIVNKDGTGQTQIDADQFEHRRLAGSVVAELTSRINMKLFVEPNNGTFSPHGV